MKNSKKATSIIEAMIILLVVVSGITGMYSIYIESIRFSDSTENKIKGIQIAKQGIEAFTNIRDTNWLIFSGNNKECWNTLNYDSVCVLTPLSSSLILTGSYIIYTDTDNKWGLKSKITLDTYGTGTYIGDFKIELDSNGIYTQSGGITNSLKPVFTREMKVEYLKEDGITIGNKNDPKMEITSFVQWRDNSSTAIHKIEMIQILSNWKK